MAPRPRLVHIHFQVPYLVVPRMWRVGRATFWPAGRLAQRMTDTREPIDEFWREPLVDNNWATVWAPAITSIDHRGREDLDTAIASARNTARDATSVLKILRLARRPLLNTSWQDFGLAPDIGRVIEHRWVTDTRGRWVSRGVQLHGTGGELEFTKADVAFYRDDARIRLLDDALRAAQPSPWQGRLLAAVRTLTTANGLDRPAMRIILAATALEALFGDDYEGLGRPATGTHQLARRAAYLWCGSEATPPDTHGNGRLACPFVSERTGRALSTRLSADQLQGQNWVCSYYEEVRALYSRRSAALHRAEDRFTARDAARAEFTVERLLLLVLEWVSQTGAIALADLEAAIAAVPA